jgi:hypothetical protein
MDDLRLIEDLGRDVPAWTDDDLAGARAALAAEIGGAAPAGSASLAAVDRPFRWRRRVLGALVSAAVAAAVAVLVVLATTVFAGSDRAAVQPPTIDTATRQALLTAAGTVGRQPDVVPHPDQFLYVSKTVSNGSQEEEWYSIDGAHDGLIIEGTTRTPIEACRNGVAMVHGNYQGLRPQPCTPMPAYLPGLPTDPQQLMVYLEKHFGARANEPNTIGRSVDELVDNHYLRSAQWAALFQAVAQLPGLRVHQHATDPAGRPAFGLSWSDPYSTGGELFFDPHTLRYTGDWAGKGGSTTGTMAIVDHPGDRP